MDLLNTVNDVLWSYLIVVILVGAALYFTIRSKGVQFRFMKDAIRIMMGRDKNPNTTEGIGKIGSFQAFAVSLASRVGTGNLAGVASAIFVGGPGAVFWMWMMALLGSATAFVEATLAQLYKRKGKDSFYGGPAYYMESGLGKKWMGILFSVIMVCTFGMGNQLVQSNTIVDSLCDSFGWDKIVTGFFLALAVLLIIVGGIRRISAVVSYMVPFMAIGFILLALVIVCLNITRIPDVFRVIFDSAFGLRQFGGGLVGTAILQGVKRGLFSNEAGEGSAPNAAAIADTSHPVKQGLVQALGVFIDTIVICTCTSFVVILFGVTSSPDGILRFDQDGILLTTRAVESFVGPAGKYFITAAIFLFAFSSILANYFYGENNISYITSKKWPVRVFQGISFFCLFLASLMTLQQVWTIIDILMGLLTLTNMAAIIMLSGKAFALLKDYASKRKAGEKDPVFRKTDIEGDNMSSVDCWD